MVVQPLEWRFREWLCLHDQVGVGVQLAIPGRVQPRVQFGKKCWSLAEADETAEVASIVFAAQRRHQPGVEGPQRCELLDRMRGLGRQVDQTRTVIGPGAILLYEQSTP